ncbi:hypothetical protein C8F04DRAFT_225173 [Mycena alexandri]|uniref:Uncharacterized protein n=1 Tax=Mycena alexandri TaxID=1745969 RepID=A0AAD6T6F5_9AGAR|nr:hypothetical protein C8F04DRAFT_225173 [Mycena alexandri]
MAGFLRKKKHDSVVPPPAPVSPVVDAPPTPLFARFATTLAEPPAQRVVSSPMTLASSPRNDQALRMINGGGAVRGAQQHEDNRTRYTVQPSYVRGNAPGSSNSTAASASIGNAQSYGSPAKNGVSSPRTRSQTLPPAAAASSPPNRRFSQVPGADKPLPSIHPQDNRPDPLGSLPPQSSLPAGRRASTRGTHSAATQNLPNGRVMAAPAQQPPHNAHPPSRAPSNAGSTQPAARTLPPSSSQTHSARPNPIPGSSQDPSRYPKEYARQDLRHKLSDAGTASGGSSAIPGPASPPRQNSPARWAPEDRAPTSYQVSLVSIHVLFFPMPCGCV